MYVADFSIMAVLALMIVSKAGSLLYYRDFKEGLKPLSPDEQIILAGTFHGIHTISQQLCPSRAFAFSPSSPAHRPSSVASSGAATSRTAGPHQHLHTAAAGAGTTAVSPRASTATPPASVSGASAGLVPGPGPAPGRFTPAQLPLPSIPATAVPTVRPKPSGLQVFETAAFRLHCFQTGTGLKLVLLTDPPHQSPDELMRRLYETFTDYVLKNPFYTLDMPVRCVKFDVALDNLIKVPAR